MKSTVLVAAAAATMLACAALPALAAEKGFVSVIGDNGDIFVLGDTFTSCSITETSAKAQFDTDGVKVVFDFADHQGTVDITGEKTWNGTVTEMRIDEPAKLFTVWGTSSTGVKFIGNGDCNPAGHP